MAFATVVVVTRKLVGIVKTEPETHVVTVLLRQREEVGLSMWSELTWQKTTLLLLLPLYLAR